LNYAFREYWSGTSAREQEIRAIIGRQASEESRREIADYIVKNDNASELIPQVLQLHGIFSKGKSPGLLKVHIKPERLLQFE
jgi:hypothetical protein